MTTAHLSPEERAAILARHEEERAGTPAAIDETLRDLSDARIADLAEDGAALFGKPWAAMDYQERRAWRARNEQARRKLAAERQQAQQAEAAEQQRRAEARAAAYRAEVKERLLATPAGRALGPQALEAAIDQALAAEAVAGAGALLAEKRRELGPLF